MLRISRWSYTVFHLRDRYFCFLCKNRFCCWWTNKDIVLQSSAVFLDRVFKGSSVWSVALNGLSAAGSLPCFAGQMSWIKADASLPNPDTVAANTPIKHKTANEPLGPLIYFPLKLPLYFLEWKKITGWIIENH